MGSAPLGLRGGFGESAPSLSEGAPLPLGPPFRYSVRACPSESGYLLASHPAAASEHVRVERPRMCVIPVRSPFSRWSNHARSIG
jgi:hypothetical protein